MNRQELNRILIEVLVEMIKRVVEEGDAEIVDQEPDVPREAWTIPEPEPPRPYYLGNYQPRN